jgi:hypothetical protein
METSLHRTLKARYGSGPGCDFEVALDGFRIDAVDGDGLLTEIQSGPLGPLRPKLRRLLPRHRLRIVKPVVLERRIVRRTRRDGEDLSVRRSPKRGAFADLFEDLVGLARDFPHPNLMIEVLGVAIDEVRIARRRWPGYKVVDRTLREILGTRILQRPADLWSLLPTEHDWTEPFTTAEIACRVGRPRWFAQRVAYCLRLSGAACKIGKRANLMVYVSSEPPRAGRTAEQSREA